MTEAKGKEKMNTQDEKAVLLLEIVKIYDKCIRSLILSHKKKNEEIGYKINWKYCGTWIYFIIILTYFICPFLYKSCNSLIIYFIAIFNTAILILFSCCEEKKGNSYDQFCSEVKDYSDDKLRFLNDYIEYLLSNNKRNNNEKVITLVFIPLFINIAANKIGQLEGLDSWLKLIGYLCIGVIFVIIYNMLPYTFNLEILKQIRVKRLIEYALLCRRMEEIKT